MKREDLAYVDTETTGLDVERHQIWEVACITFEAGKEVERVWHLPVDLGRADPMALKIGGFHARHGEGAIRDTPYTPLHVFAEEFAGITRGKHIVGAVISFDDQRLAKLLRSHGACPEWHYHILCVENIALGYLHGRSGRDVPEVATALPYKSEDLCRAVGVNPEDPRFAKHTALGDARWAKAVFETIIPVEE